MSQTAELTHGHQEPQDLFEQFEDLEQQNSTYVLGMWSFLVTEVMFFGVLFMTYFLYRWRYQDYFYEAHNELSIMWGGINTFNLLISSFAVVMAVRCAQLRNKWGVLKWLGLTQMCALVFMVIKFIEYKSKYDHGIFLLLPGGGTSTFHWHNPEVPANIAQLFFSLYFATTGLHGVHVVIGMIIFAVMMLLYFKDHPIVKKDFIPLELCGLYWHFVDLVWIFVYPLFYLIPK
jgi:cytochrome c oxidase subunit III